MWESWRLARVRAMRLTMFVFPHDLLEIAASATRHISEAFATRWLRDSGLSQPEFERLAAAVYTALGDEPLMVRLSLGFGAVEALPGTGVAHSAQRRPVTPPTTRFDSTRSGISCIIECLSSAIRVAEVPSA